MAGIIHKTPMMRVSNTFVRNMIQGIDKRTLNRIVGGNAETRQELLLNGAVFKGLTPLDQQIIKIIQKKVSDFYYNEGTNFISVLEKLETFEERELIENNFFIPIELDYKEIYKILNSGKRYGNYQIQNIDQSIEKLCSVEYSIIFDIKQHPKKNDKTQQNKGRRKTKSYIIRQTLIQKGKANFVKSNNGEERKIGIKVYISNALIMSLHNTREISFVPKHAIQQSSHIGKDEITQYFYNVLIYNADNKIVRATLIRRNGEKNNLSPEEIDRQVREALTYSETFNNLKIKFQKSHIERPARFKQMLLKASNNFIEIGLTTGFYISENAVREKSVNFIINENYILDTPTKLLEV